MFRCAARAWIGLPLLVLVVTDAALAQDAEPTAFRTHRYDEDWRALCEPARRTQPLDPLKCLPLGGAATLTLGGELRERGELVDDPGFRLEGSRDQALLTRVMLHGDLRLDDRVRVFVQLGGFYQIGREEGPSPTDADRLDLVQAFVDLNAKVAGGRATLRAGRQELSFGSQRIVSVREGPNVRRAFDGVRALWSGGEVRLDAFYLQPVLLRRGVFDDETDEREAFYGVHATTAIHGPLKLDLYLFDYRRREARFGLGRGREERRSLGLRLFGQAGGWDWDAEGLYQWGSFAGRTIRAWTIATDTGFTFAAAPLSPRLGLKADIASGDRNPADGRLGTFNALYPKFPYFSEANLVAPANLMDLSPSLTISPNRKLELSIAWDLLWRHTTRDAIYEPQLSPIPQAIDVSGRYIGDQAIFGFEWEVNKTIKLSGQIVHFEPGRALQSIGGRDVDFAVIAAALKF